MFWPLIVAVARPVGCWAAITAGRAAARAAAANCNFRESRIKASNPRFYMRTLLLFDIDGTLILSGRAGLRALNRAFEEQTGVADAFRGINAAGRTDGYLLREAA